MPALLSNLSADHVNTAISVGCFVLTVALYFASKRLYAYRKTLLFSPLHVISDGFTTTLAERGAYVSVFGLGVLVATWWFRRGGLARRLVPVAGLVEIGRAHV